MTNPELTDITAAGRVSAAITEELSKCIVGQKEIVAGLVASLFANGHCLLIGVPGLAKTLLVQSVAKVLGVDFKRIQFTPDLMPSDILGSEVIHEHNGQMEFRFRPAGIHEPPSRGRNQPHPSENTVRPA